MNRSARTGRCFRAAAGLAAVLLLGLPANAQPSGTHPAARHETVRLWPGAAPGTESWTGPEAEVDAELPTAGKVHIITNVTAPTLTLVRPRPGTANGTAMLVVPGGAFRALAWDLEGIEIANWLAVRGITAFVLKYRVRPPTDAPAGAERFEDWARRTRRAREIADADARQAMRFVRGNAARYGIAPNRIGMIGSSAGAMTVMDVASSTDAASRPDFAVPVYGAVLSDELPPADAPPLFIVAAQDDPKTPVGKSVEIFERWTQAGRPAELHLYERGGHAFGLRAHRLPADHWGMGLEAWLLSHGLVGAASRAAIR